MSKEQSTKIQRQNMSPRQLMLDRLWKEYCCTQYDNCRVDWNGQEIPDPVEREAVVQAGFIPAGFYSVGQELPVKFRKPSAPSGMTRLVVSRFTGLLFSDRTHPRIIVPGDPDTEDYLQALAEASQLWACMSEAREFGGATGDACVGFKFVDGELQIEVHDPRFIRPKFKPGASKTLAELEIRYIYHQEDWDPDTQDWVTYPVWFRRVINESSDIVYEPEWVTKDEPEWQEAEHVDHGFGFCPVIWIQNIPVQNDVDGLPDVPQSARETIHQIDMLDSQAHKGTLANCDPTTVVKTDNEPEDDLMRGSDGGIQVETSGDVKFLEMNGQSIKTAMDLSDKDRKHVSEVSEVVLPGDEASGAEQTATEIERKHGPMYAKADRLRGQYGKRGVVILLKMILKALRAMEIGKVVDGQIVKQTVTLPPRVEKGDDGKTKLIPRKLGKFNAQIMLKWPRYYPPSLNEIDLAVRAAAGAKLAKLVDEEHAITMLAEYFGVDDVQAMIDRIKQEAKDEQKQLDQIAMAGRVGGGGFGAQAPVPGKKLLTP